MSSLIHIPTFTADLRPTWELFLDLFQVQQQVMHDLPQATSRENEWAST